MATVEWKETYTVKDALEDSDHLLAQDGSGGTCVLPGSTLAKSADITGLAGQIDDINDAFEDVESAQASLGAAIDAIVADPTEAVTEIFVPAKAMDSIINSNPTWGSVAAGRIGGWMLPESVASFLAFPARVPSHWATYTVDIWYTNVAASAGNVSLSVGRAEWVEGDSLDVTPAGSTTTDAADATAWTVSKASIVTANSITPSKFQTFRLSRNGNSGSDTLANSILLLGVTLKKAS